MTSEDLLAVCRLVVSSRWQDVAMFADATGRVVVWAGEADQAKRVVDGAGHLLGTSGTSTHAHALLLELMASQKLWRAEIPPPRGSHVAVVDLTTVFVTLYGDREGEERARHLTDMVRDAIREGVARDAVLARVRALVKTKPGRLPS